MNIAIIGAGMAGLSAARSLVEDGQDVMLFDKSRGVGGRMATRRTGAFSFDHGAQFVTARDPEFRKVLKNAGAAGYTALWGEDRHVGVPGMSALPGYMSNGLTILTEAPVARLERANGHLLLRDATDAFLGSDEDGFDAVILAIPAPQASAICSASGLAIDGLADIAYAPSWALMLGYEQPTGFAPTARTFDDPAVGWIARNSSKPGRAPLPETFVVHATAEWSLDNLEWTPARVAEHLHTRFCALTGITRAPDLIRAHRWRYAFVSRALGRPCLWDDRLKIGACGDWAIGPRVEAAFLSGQALAAAILAELR